MKAVLQEGNKIPEGWRDVRLGDLLNENFCVIKNHLRQPLSSKERSSMKGKYPYYGAASQIDSIHSYKVEGFHLLIAEDGTVTSDGKKPMLQLVDGKFWVSNHSHILQGKTEKETLLLYYMLRTVVITPYITGAVQPKLSKGNLLKIKLLLPPPSEQKIIAEILSSLDEKIELLHRQNQTLENMAQTLFRKWFVEDATAESEEKPLSYFGKIICGKTPSKKVHEYFDGKIPFIKIPDMHRKVFIFDTVDTLTEKGKNSQNNKTLLIRSICVSCIATVGLVAMNAFESQTNQQINSIIPRKDEYRYLIYLFMKSSKRLLDAMASGGTVAMNLNTGNFSKIMVLATNEKLIFMFHNTVNPIFEKIFSNQSQIRLLEKLRDTLLPKLMSGKVRLH